MDNPTSAAWLTQFLRGAELLFFSRCWDWQQSTDQQYQSICHNFHVTNSKPISRTNYSSRRKYDNNFGITNADSDVANANRPKPHEEILGAFREGQDRWPTKQAHGLPRQSDRLQWRWMGRLEDLQDVNEGWQRTKPSSEDAYRIIVHSNNSKNDIVPTRKTLPFLTIPQDTFTRR